LFQSTAAKAVKRASLAWRCQMFSAHQSGTILCITFTQDSPRTDVKVMLSSTRLVLSTPLNPGVQVELWQESQESLVLVLPDLDRLLSVTCAERLECSLLSKYGGNGMPKPTTPRDVMPLLQLLLHLLSHLLSWPEVTMSSLCLNFLLWLTMIFPNKLPPVHFSVLSKHVV